MWIICCSMLILTAYWNEQQVNLATQLVSVLIAVGLAVGKDEGFWLVPTQMGPGNLKPVGCHTLSL